MSFIEESFFKAFSLIFSVNTELFQIIRTSLAVSGTAMILALLVSAGLIYLLEFRKFPGKTLLITLINTLMGLPPVVVGLLLYLLLSRSGPLGVLELLYTPTAMIFAQAILATPIITGLSFAAIRSADPAIKLAALSLGATEFQATCRLVLELRYSILASVVAGLGRLMAEVGAVLMVGGNIAGYTRMMTTSIVMEADKGDFELAIALGIILLLIAFTINGALHFLQKRT
ncbi:MAG: ABC transporter permease [SAR324 cluster bacterium]|nr:ABC transporter permease [SAR324 cluster bacterium]